MNKLFRTVTDSHASIANDDNVARLHNPTPLEQKILIQDLGLEMFIGVFDEEKKNPQKVVVDVELTIDPSSIEMPMSDDIKDFVSYADIIADIKELSTQNHVNLVETFAEMIIQKCFEYEQIVQANITVMKPNVMAGSCNVGVQISKKK